MPLRPSKKTAIQAAAVALAATFPATVTLANEATPLEPILASSIVEDDGGSERINFSGKLRMLSQRIPAAACNLAAGIAPDASHALLKGATKEFQDIVNALEFGNDDMGVYGAEERRKTLAAIEELKGKWQPVEAAASAMIDGDTSDALLATLMDENMALLGAAKLLVSEISGQYSDPAALLQSDALRVDIAGRQRMLTQKISKEICQIKSGINVAEATKAVSGTINMFSTSLNALQFGMPEAGITAAPETNIIEGLEQVASDWSTVSTHMTAFQAGEEWDADTRAVVFNTLNTTMAKMNKVVGMYVEASKLDI